MNMRIPLLVAFSTLILTGCGSVETDPTYSDKQKEELYKHGSVVSDEGGINIFGDDSKKSADSAGIGVNAFLWRATLDTISFLPILSADPFGGVILTDWYSAPQTPNERMKLNVFIRDRDLRADGVKVSVFRQTRGANKEWADAPVNPSTSTDLENAILTKARQTRLSQKQFQ